MNKNVYKTGNANIIPSDFPDPDVIRVDDTYYMVSTTMHFFPGCEILKSYNLIDWEFCSYVYDELEITEGQTLKNNKGIYGKGMWAATIRYYKGIFYIAFVANDTHKTYLYTSTKVTGPWKKSTINGFFHDMSLLFEEDKILGDRVFVVYGNTDIYLTELENDLSGPKQGGVNKLIIQDDKEKINLGYEGSHFYKINGKYYIFCIHAYKNGLRSQACFVSENIDGPYKGQQVLDCDFNNWNSGIAQGGIVQSSDGNWYGISFQDHGALGRIPYLISVQFKNDFPVFGVKGKVPETVSVLDNKPEYKYTPLYTNDFFNPEGKLLSAWQWNHIPDYSLISFSENKLTQAVTIKTDKIVKNIVQAANTLTQRTYNEICSGSICVDASSINEGDFAGLCALEGEYAFIGFTKEQGKYYIVAAQHKIPYSQWAMGVYDEDEPEIIFKKEVSFSETDFKLCFDLRKDTQSVDLLYKDDGCFKTAGICKLRYTLDQFVGVRFALFIYSTKITGGKAMFKNFNIEIK